MARNSIYWYQNEKWISVMNRNGSINLYQSALSIIYGNTITQPTTQSPLSHCQHLIKHSLTDLTIHSLHNSLSRPFTHKTILLLLVHSLNHCFFYSLSNTNAIQFNSTFSHPHSFLHSLTHSTMHFTHSATCLCEHESLKGQSCLVRVSSVCAFFNGMWCI